MISSNKWLYKANFGLFLLHVQLPDLGFVVVLRVHRANLQPFHRAFFPLKTLQDRLTRKNHSPHLNYLSPSRYRQELLRELHHTLTRASCHFESLANEKTKYFKAIHLVSGLQILVPDFSQQPE